MLEHYTKEKSIIKNKQNIIKIIENNKIFISSFVFLISLFGYLIFEIAISIVFGIDSSYFINTKIFISVILYVILGIFLFTFFYLKLFLHKLLSFLFFLSILSYFFVKLLNPMFYNLDLKATYCTSETYSFFFESKYQKKPNNLTGYIDNIEDEKNNITIKSDILYKLFLIFFDLYSFLNFYFETNYFLDRGIILNNKYVIKFIFIEDLSAKSHLIERRNKKQLFLDKNNVNIKLDVPNFKDFKLITNEFRTSNYIPLLIKCYD